MAESDSDSDRGLLESLLRLSREISAATSPALPLHRRTFASAARKARLLAHLFEELLLSPLPSSAALCLREILVALHRFKSLLADLSSHSRCRLILRSDSISARFRDISLDLSSLLGLLPLQDLQLSADCHDLLALLRRHCQRSNSDEDDHRLLRSDVLSVIRELERGVVPGRARLESIFCRLGIDGPAACRHEIGSLEREIADDPAIVALAGLFRYAKCVVFGASTPRSESLSSSSSSAASSNAAAAASQDVPADFRCPISLDLMRDPVVVATGQTYDRESISRWIAAGHATCPNSGQTLAHTNVIPNRALKNLIARWCRDHKIHFDSDAAEGGAAGGGAPAAEPGQANKAALAAARMTASFLVQKLGDSRSDEAANRVVHELRLLAKSGSENREFVAEAGGIPLLLPLLASDDPALQVNAVTALLNLSILEANKKRIMHADGGIDGVVRVLADGATWRARENAAATVLSLSSVHAYRRRLGRYPRVVESLVEMVTSGPATAQKDALLALAGLAGDRENVDKLVAGGAVLAAVEAASTADEAVAVLAAVAKRGGAAAVGLADGAVPRLVRVMMHGSDWARENAVATLVLICRKAGGCVAGEVAATPGIESLIWDLMGSGTDRTKRKAAALGRICRRWVAAAEAADLTAMFSVAAEISAATARA